MPDIILPEKPSDRDKDWEGKFSNSMPFEAFVRSITQSNYPIYANTLWEQPQGLAKFLAKCLPSELNLLLGHPLWPKMEERIARTHNCLDLFNSTRAKLARYHLKRDAHALPPQESILDEWVDAKPSDAVHSRGSEMDSEDEPATPNEACRPDVEVDYNRHGRTVYPYIASRIALFFRQEPLPWTGKGENPTQRIINGMSAPKITRDINALMAILRSTRDDVTELDNAQFARDVLQEYSNKMDALLEELHGVVEIREQWERVLMSLHTCHQ